MDKHNNNDDSWIEHGTVTWIMIMVATGAFWLGVALAPWI